MVDNIKASEESLHMQYSEICKSYHTVRDVQLKLLAFIPVLSGIAASLLIGKQINTENLHIVGALGLIFTIGIFLYGIRADQHASALIRHGALVERLLNLEIGQYKDRPTPRFGFLGYTAALILIYLGLAAVWVYVIAFGKQGLNRI
jgi:hypothetical protein